MPLAMVDVEFIHELYRKENCIYPIVQFADDRDNQASFEPSHRRMSMDSALRCYQKTW